MSLTPEQISENWNTLLSTIDQYISSPRKEKLTDFYNKYEERLTLMPAAHKKEYHNAFPGGYIDHVNRVVAPSQTHPCLLYTSPSPRDRTRSRMPSSA